MTCTVSGRALNSTQTKPKPKLLIAVLRAHAAAPLLLGAGHLPLSIDLIPALSSKPAARRCCSRLMRQTDGRSIVLLYADNVN